MKEQHLEEVEVISSLSSYKEGYRAGQSYVHFILAERPNQLGSKWQHKGCLMLEDEVEGTIVIDVLEDKHVGRVEFLKYL